MKNKKEHANKERHVDTCLGCGEKFETVRARYCSPECKLKHRKQVYRDDGRTTSYKDEYCDLLIEHMAQGLSYTTFAAAVGVSVATIYNWEQHQPKFLEAKKFAIRECQLFWEKMGIDGAKGAIRNFSSGTWVYNMKCRFRDEWLIEREIADNKDVTVKIAYDPGE